MGSGDRGSRLYLGGMLQGRVNIRGIRDNGARIL